MIRRWLVPFFAVLGGMLPYAAVASTLFGQTPEVRSATKETLTKELPTKEGATKKPAVNDETMHRLKETITYLSETLGERNLRRPMQLEQAAKYVQSRWEAMGYSIEKQSFLVDEYECINLATELVGTKYPKEIVLIGAHYDSARGTPGANDNGSGTAALLEIAQQLQGKPCLRTVRFVAFTNEEPPYFQQKESMGSWVYARACRERGDQLVSVVSLETMGYFSDEANSQKYPPLLAALYPNTGNFIGFVSNVESRKLLTETVNIFRQHCQVDAQLGAFPAELQGVGWSDHWSFWQEGYQGIMVTDTAPFRYPHYHVSTDTVDRIDFERYSQVVDGLAKTVVDFANREARD